MTKDGKTAVTIPVVLAIVLGLVLLAFALPATNAAPHDVPIGVAGPPPAVEQLRAQLAQAPEGSFEIHEYADTAELTEAIEDRDVYGGIAIEQSGPTMLTAPAASPVVAQLLSQLAQQASAQGGSPMPVTEVVSLPDDDARGAGLAAAMLPLLLGSIMAAGAGWRAVRAKWAGWAVTLATSVTIGLTVTAILHALGVFTGSWWLDAAAIIGVLAATSTAVYGLARVFGLIGIGLGAILLVVVGNPLSGVTSAPELVPEGWSTVGALLPPGAASQLLRSTAYFDGAGASGRVWVLAGWFAIGVLLIVLARRGRDVDAELGEEVVHGVDLHAPSRA